MDAARPVLTRLGVAASADELRGRRKLCQLQYPCVEFVLDSHALELRVLGLIFGVETVLQNPSGTAVEHAHFSVEETLYTRFGKVTCTRQG